MKVVKERCDVSDSKQSGIRGERRHEERLECTPAIVHTRLNGREEDIVARVKEMSGTGLQLHTDVPFPIAAPVTIDLADRTVYGEIRHCEPRSNLSWSVGVLIRDFRLRDKVAG